MRGGSFRSLAVLIVDRSGSIGLRQCRVCGLTGPLESFARGAASRYGRLNLCLKCFHKRSRRYAAARRARVGSLALNVTLSARFARLKYKAQVRDIPIDLTREQWEVLVADPCHYCGGPLELTGYGLDRKDTHGAYTLANVVACCRACNRRKKDQPYELARARLANNGPEDHEERCYLAGYGEH